jgi:glycosyltransferase involved in cell wall biosynthesis
MSAQHVLFVAHDVGGPGGMERHSEELIQRLLDQGQPVTVLARTCRLQPREGLRFVRVPTPARPFTIAYPLFFAVGSLLAGRSRGALLHTTGAIIGNRSDLATVHYCHHAPAARAGLRASRATRLYRANAAAAQIMARAGERWCYRPTRTRVLSAVSAGVAAELRGGFPEMASVVRVVPNGVDTSLFRPDPALRAAARARLGVAEDSSLALFVGGDWTRKGLGHAVDALSAAPRWLLAVAGPGDRGQVIARARSLGVDGRVMLLGRVPDPANLYRAADALVFPTSYEAFPLVLLEAAASGLPLLATRVNGTEDLLIDGVNGWFITQDGLDIAEHLNELRSSPELAGRMGQRARDAVAAFTWDAMTESYRSLYRELRVSDRDSQRRSATAVTDR